MTRQNLFLIGSLVAATGLLAMTIFILFSADTKSLLVLHLDNYFKVDSKETFMQRVARTANSVFIKLWLNMKHSTINRYSAFVVN